MAVSRPDPQSHIRRFIKSFASLAFVVFVLGACSSDGFPESYADQVDQETNISNVESNWIQGCTVAYASTEEARDEPFSKDATSVCQCSFDAISADGGEPGILFDDFRSIDNDLDGDAGALGKESPTAAEERIVEIVSGCLGIEAAPADS